MKKKYVVRLSAEEKATCEEVVKKLKGRSQKVMRAQILLKADIDGPGWTDDKIAEAFGCSRQAVEQICERLVTNGFELTLDGKRPSTPPRPKLLSGEQEAELKNQMIELEIMDTISHETVRKTLKKMD